MRKIDRNLLRALLASVTGATAVSITAETEPEMRRRNNPFWGRVRKIARVNGMIGWRYGNSVNRQRLREGLPGDFVPDRRAWGRRGGNPLVYHEGREYLEIKIERVRYEYRLDGQPVDEVQILPFLPTRREGARQGVAKPVVLRDYALDNIRAVSISGKDYAVE